MSGGWPWSPPGAVILEAQLGYFLLGSSSPGVTISMTCFRMRINDQLFDMRKPSSGRCWHGLVASLALCASYSSAPSRLAFSVALLFAGIVLSVASPCSFTLFSQCLSCRSRCWRPQCHGITICAVLNARNISILSRLCCRRYFYR